MYNPTQRLMRSRSDKVIAGVAGGIGQYLAIDPVLVRLAFVALAFTGVGLLLYPVLWIIMPIEGGQRAAHGICQVFFLLRAGMHCRRGQRQQQPAGKAAGGGHCAGGAHRAQFASWLRTWLTTSATLTAVACASRRPWYSTLPSFRPRSPTTTRCAVRP